MYQFSSGIYSYILPLLKDFVPFRLVIVKEEYSYVYILIHIYFSHTQIALCTMASNYAPLTPEEKHQLQTQPNIDLILAWATVRGIVRHPEVLQQIQIKTREVIFSIFNFYFVYKYLKCKNENEHIKNKLDKKK